MRLLGFVVLASTAACGGEQSAAPPPVPRAGALTEGVVATVAQAAIHQRTVGRIQAAKSLSVDEALQRAVVDALFAQGAEATLPDATQRVIVRGALARALLESLQKEAEQRGPPTDEEVEEIRRERWADVDRPPGVRVTHAVALSPVGSANTAAARAVAQAIAEATRGISEPEAFLAAARSVPTGAVQVRAERLQPFTRDGRIFSMEGAPIRPGESLDRAFAEAAHELGTPGEQSGIVESPFGFHVVLLEARLPEHRVPIADLRRVLTPEVVSRRADRAQKALVSSLSSGAQVEVARDFDAQTAGLGGS